MTILPPFRSESLPIIKEIMDLLLNETAVLSDAIVWLQGNRFDRGEKVLALWTEERASLVVLSGNNVLLGDTRPGEDNVSVVQMKDWLNERGVPTDQICVDEQAMNTKDQAKNVLALAVARGWRRIILVASMEHQLRAFLTFLKATQAQGWWPIEDREGAKPIRTRSRNGNRG